MKLSTKIMLGLTALLMLVFIGSMVYLSTKQLDQNEMEFSVSNEMKTVVLSRNYKVIQIVEPNELKNQKYMLSGVLELKHASTTDELTKLMYSENIAALFDQRLEGDTLRIQFKPELLNKQSLRRINGIVITAFVDSSVTVICNTPDMGIKAESLKINSLQAVVRAGGVEIANCELENLSVGAQDYGEVNIKNSSIKNFKLDLDHIYNRNIENSSIQVAYITGNNGMPNDFSNDGYQSIYWVPKNNESYLDVRLSGDTTKIELPRR